MSPQPGSVGAIGFTDFQRTVNWDGPLLYSGNNVLRSGTVLTAILDVSRYAYLGGSLLTSIATLNCTINWFSDSAGANVVAFRQFVIDPAILGLSPLRLPNLGPFVQMQFQPIAAGPTWRDNNFIFGTNRVHPLEFIPTNPSVIAFLAAPLAASGIDIKMPACMYSGPLRVFFNPTFASAALLFEFETPTATWAEFDVRRPAAGVEDVFDTVAPIGAWRCRVFNSSGAAGTYNLVGVPSLTGST